MDDQVRHEISAHFRREAGGMPAGVRERALGRLAEEAARPGRSPARRLEWLAAVAAVLLAVTLVGTLVAIGLSRPAGRLPQPAGQPPPGPMSPSRLAPAVAYDAARGTLVLFGGESNGTVQGDTWVWDGQHGWTLAHPPSSPPARRDGLAVYDEARREVVLVGGESATGVPLGDTWTWDGRTWRRHATATVPAAAGMDSAVYDPVTRSVLLYVQPGKGARSPDLWRWDGKLWSRLADGPPTPILGELVPDGRRVLLVGNPGNGAPAAETWVWEGGAWTRLSPATPLPLLGRAGLAYDPGQGRVVVLLVGAAQLETWVWDGATWSRLHPAHEPSPGRWLFWDQRASSLVWVGPGGTGGGMQVWRWDGRDWTLVTTERGAG